MRTRTHYSCMRPLSTTVPHNLYFDISQLIELLTDIDTFKPSDSLTLTSKLNETQKSRSRLSVSSHSKVSVRSKK